MVSSFQFIYTLSQGVGRLFLSTHRVIALLAFLSVALFAQGFSPILGLALIVVAFVLARRFGDYLEYVVYRKRLSRQIWLDIDTPITLLIFGLLVLVAGRFLEFNLADVLDTRPLEPWWADFFNFAAGLIAGAVVAH